MIAGYLTRENRKKAEENDLIIFPQLENPDRLLKKHNFIHLSNLSTLVLKIYKTDIRLLFSRYKGKCLVIFPQQPVFYRLRPVLLVLTCLLHHIFCNLRQFSRQTVLVRRSSMLLLPKLPGLRYRLSRYIRMLLLWRALPCLADALSGLAPKA